MKLSSTVSHLVHDNSPVLPEEYIAQFNKLAIHKLSNLGLTWDEVYSKNMLYLETDSSTGITSLILKECRGKKDIFVTAYKL